MLAKKLQGGTAVAAGGWDLSNAVFNGGGFGSFDLSAEDTSPSDIFFKPDGSKMYVVGITNDSVYEYNLNPAWEVTSAQYAQSFSVASQDASPTGLFFKSDGTKMYVLGSGGDDVNEYDLSTAWDISSASYLQNFSVASQDTSPQSLFFKSDGTKMYILGGAGDDVNEYNLSTAWDISTASYLQNFSVASQDTQPLGIFFKPDGTKMYMCGSAVDRVNEYDLSTAWDISTASFSQNFSVNSRRSNPQGIQFKSDGTVFYVVGPTVEAYDLSTAWDVSTATNPSPTSDYFSVNAQETNPEGLFFKPDGTKMYITGATGDDVNEYDLSTPWDITTATYLQRFSVVGQDTTPSALAFKSDGTKMYVLGFTSDYVNEYDLSAAWDVSSASYLQRFYVGAEETSPLGLFFKPDGSKMYVCGILGDDVNEYDLSTAWNVSTASYLQSFSVSAQDTSPSGVLFKPDGTKMYVSGDNTDAVYEYDLSTAWDISSASYLQAFSVAGQETSMEDLFFKPDGKKLYIIGSFRDAVWSYDL